VWDLIVVGAGPAGATAALSALAHEPRAAVLLIDRDDFPRDKACGDGIAPHAMDVLGRLGVAADATWPEVPRMRLGFAGGPTVVGSFRRPAYVVPRTSFDARLVEAAVARGAQLRRQQVRHVEHRGDRVLVDGEAARVVVGADGANGVVRRELRLADPANGTVALALRGYAPVPASDRVRRDEQVIVFAEHGWPAYAWSFPIGDGRANVGYGEVLHAAGHPSRADLLSRLDSLLPGAGEGATQWRAHHLPLSTGRPRQPGGRVLLAGDALSLINPLTGEGIYYAVLSGLLAGAAAVALATGDPGTAYRRALRRELGAHLRHTDVVARLARHRRVVAAGVAAAARDGHVFDDLVEVGLGRGRLTARVVTGLAAAPLRPGRP
jgi:geranylgeranyl reductase family protein